MPKSQTASVSPNFFLGITGYRNTGLIKVIDIVIYNADCSPVRFYFVSCFFVCHLFSASVPHLVLGR